MYLIWSLFAPRRFDFGADSDVESDDEENEVLCNSYCGETYGSNDFGTLENVRESILRMTYYWYNLMPLSRGSAVVGLQSCLDWFWLLIWSSLPEGRQVDWDSIISLWRSDGCLNFRIERSHSAGSKNGFGNIEFVYDATRDNPGG